MIVLHKKRLIVTSILLFVVVFSSLLATNKMKENKTVETVSLPVSNKVIVLDAGHGVPDERC